MPKKKKEENILKTTASGDELRARLPIDSWLPLNLHLVELLDGMLKLSPLYDLPEPSLRKLRHAMARRGYFMKDVVVDLWDRRALYEELKYAHERFYDYPEKVLLGWFEDVTSKDMPILFFRSIIEQALREDVDKIRFLPTVLNNSGIQILYYKKGQELLKYVLPDMLAISFQIFLEELFEVGENKSGRFMYHWFNDEIELDLSILDASKKLHDSEIKINIEGESE